MGFTAFTFSWVGHRLRLVKLAAFLPLITAAILTAIATSIYFQPARIDVEREMRLREAERSPDEATRTKAARDRERITLDRASRAAYRNEDVIAFALAASLFAGLGTLLLLAARKPPTRAVLLYAKHAGGTLTLTDLSTALNIDPKLAARALAQLQALKIATPRWEDYRKNVWEFPDCLPPNTSDHLSAPPRHPALDSLTRPSFSTDATPPHQAASVHTAVPA